MRDFPKGWECQELSAIAKFKSGGTPDRSRQSYWGGDLPWISAKDMKSFELNGAQEGLTALAVKKVTVVPKDTVLILVRGMGLFKDVPVGLTTRPVAFNQDIKALIPYDGVVARFLAYSLVALRGTMMGRVDHAGHGTGRLSTDYLSTLPIVLPPESEQKRIVAVLGAWDEAISHTACLIDIKKRRKTALLQKLFADLPRRLLSDAATIWFSGVDKKSRADEHQVKLCNYTDVFGHSRITSSLPFMKATASKREIATNKLRLNDVIFTKDSETASQIAEPALVAEEINGLICGYHLAIARPKPDVAHGPFLAQAMRHPEIRWQFARLANGVVRFGLTLDAVSQAEIFLPDLPTQYRIAAALDIEDATTDELVCRLRLLREQRLGLMQKLLTGEWRLSERVLGGEA